MATKSTTKSDRTKAALRTAAAACFRELGFQAATTAEIARRAEVAEGTVFLHYTNKLSLLTAVTRDFYDQLQADGERASAAPDTPTADRLRNLVDSWTWHMGRHWDLIQVFIQTSQNQPGTELAEAVIQLNRRYTRLCVGLLDQLKIEGALPVDVPTSLLRDMLFGTLEHTARGQQYAGEPINTAAVGTQLLDLILRNPRPANSAGERLEALDHKLDRILDHLDNTPR